MDTNLTMMTKECVYKVRMKAYAKTDKYKQKSLLCNTWENKSLLLMATPVIILLILFNYVPMFGSLVAFKKFNYIDGIWNSPWVGLRNFKFLFSMKSLTWRMLRNTVGYYFLFTLVGTICNVTLAVALNECKNKYFSKYSQTCMIMPTFVSYIAVSFIASCFLDINGILNQTLFEKDTVVWYQEAKYWPIILTILKIWKDTGYGSIVYLSALAGMDRELFEAADLDGATKWKQIRYITLPLLTSMVCIMTLLGLGSIMISNTGLFYQVTKDSSMIYETTQTIDTYVMKTMVAGTGDFGPASAVSFFQSVVGCTLTIVVNMIVRKISPDNALF